jgi:NAD(P)-dependent dehydrogenase (short-subunit alcohol dehydrogenase family)
MARDAEVFAGGVAVITGAGAGIDSEVFAGGVAVITGAGAGIGSGLARRAGQLGMTVVVADIDGARAEVVAGQIRDADGRAEAVVVDVSRPAELERLADHVFTAHGSPRLLVNNAGIETIGFSWEIPVERWEATLNINIHGVVHGCRAFLPRMLENGREAWIANLSSMGAMGVMPCQTAYIMSKHAVQSFSECLYLELELKDAPIHVSSVLPGMLKTSIFEAEAGRGEPPAAAAHRRKMFEMMRDHGMDLDEGCRSILDQIARNKFWVHTQPEMSLGAMEGRIAFFRRQQGPTMNDEVRYLVAD